MLKIHTHPKYPTQGPMFGKFFPNDLEICRELTRGQSLVYLTLVLHSNKSRQCWPSQITIAKRTGLSRQTVIRTIRLLEKNGTIKSISRGGRSSKIYKLPAGKETFSDPDVTSRSYIEAGPAVDVTFKPVGVTFEPVGVTLPSVDVTPESYTNREQKEHINSNEFNNKLLNYSLCWTRYAQEIRLAEWNRNQVGTLQDELFAAIRSFRPVAMEGERLVLSINIEHIDLSKRIREPISKVLGFNPIYRYTEESL